MLKPLVLASATSALIRGIHPLIIFKMADVQGEMPHRLGPWRQHFDDELWRGSGYAFLAESTFCVSLFRDHMLLCNSY
jgi:hypothetical protein